MVNQTVAAAILMGLFFALIILHLPITFSLCIATGACMIYCKIRKTPTACPATK